MNINVLEERRKLRRKEPEIIVFEDHSKRKKKKVEIQSPESEDKKPIVDIETARHEVYKFGISGFDKQKAIDAREALAIKLGAKPPKRKYQNYKILMQEKKLKKIQEMEERKRNQKTGISKKPSNKRRRKKDKNLVKNFSCQIGKYKDGIQFISQKEISKVKNRVKGKHV